MTTISRRVTKILKEGRRITGPLFTAYFHPRVNLEKPLLVVSQKVAKKATERNFIRRRLKEALRRTKLDGAWVILIKAKAAQVSFPEIQKEVARLDGRSEKNG